MNIDIEFLKYPIGKFQVPNEIKAEAIQEAVETIKSFPKNLFTAVSPMTAEQLDTPYRPGGWTVRQLVHHCADSHMNAFVRFKLALTESNPTIKPYEEAEWAKLADYSLPVEPALALIVAIHLKLGILMDSMSEGDFLKTYYHPESKRSQSLGEVTLMYAWHSQHHLAHIQHLALRNYDQ
ncbi:YfiT family bacillithiol transferase [Algoriphagus mannitolivorans]|uniref:YfiT family bacillithiol transferase n=1 Tax=Algoriphagus mannitolivorans TaxID=226504 RepID=UPI000420BDB2|nr:putative metal-dependent hydrolase [Algoriphagus mannitolivorans]